MNTSTTTLCELPKWAGELVVIIASGPSLTAVDADYCEGRARCIVVNDNYRMAPWADALYAADPEWWDHNKGVSWFAGERWTQDAGAAENWGINHIESRPLPGLSLDPGVIHQGHNSGYQALNLAVLWGASTIALLGFDMQRTRGMDHWFGSHPSNLRRPARLERWASAFDSTRDQLAESGVRVVNCSRESAITCYPRLPLSEVV